MIIVTIRSRLETVVNLICKIHHKSTYQNKICKKQWKDGAKNFTLTSLQQEIGNDRIPKCSHLRVRRVIIWLVPNDSPIRILTVWLVPILVLLLTFTQKLSYPWSYQRRQFSFRNKKRPSLSFGKFCKIILTINFRAFLINLLVQMRLDFHLHFMLKKFENTSDNTKH